MVQVLSLCHKVGAYIFKLMQVEYKGHKYDAYSLVMRRENAEAILRGEKKLEVRASTPYYQRMFIDENRPLEEDEIVPFRNTCAVHFYSTGAPWTLDCFIDKIGVAELTAEDVADLGELYDFHDFDDEVKKYEGVPDDERPEFFYLAIDEIIGSKGL